MVPPLNIHHVGTRGAMGAKSHPTPQQPLNLGLHFSAKPARELLLQATAIMDDELRVCWGDVV